MRKSAFFFTVFFSTTCISNASANLMLSGVIDGPLSGGTPKAIELFATADILDLSHYGIGVANNGGGSDGIEFTLSGSASAGDFLYIASESTNFDALFGFAPTFTSRGVSLNGDDAIELFLDGAVIDVFGDINVDGSGQPWDYLDGWAYRKNGTLPQGALFDSSQWLFSGINALDGVLTNGVASAPFPLASFRAQAVSEPAVMLLMLLGLPLLLVNRYRRSQSV